MVLGLGDRVGGWKEGALDGGLRGVGGKNENYVMDSRKDNDVISTAYRCLLLWAISITHISQLRQFMPLPETYKSEIGSQSTMCQVHTGAYVSLLAPGKTDYTACHPRKTTTYIRITRSIYHCTTHTQDRLRSIGEEKQRKKRRHV